MKRTPRPSTPNPTELRTSGPERSLAHARGGATAIEYGLLAPEALPAVRGGASMVEYALLLGPSLRPGT